MFSSFFVPLFKSILLLVVVGSSISGVFSLFFDWSLLKFSIATAIAIVLQITVKWYADLFRSSRIQELVDTMPSPTIKMNIECAFCKKPSIIDYNVYEEEYECVHCKNINAIYGKFYAARKVVPVDTLLTNHESSIQ